MHVRRRFQKDGGLCTKDFNKNIPNETLTLINSQKWLLRLLSEDYIIDRSVRGPPLNIVFLFKPPP
jgi:hypothetical protein